MKDLKELRDQIDVIDRQIVDLYQERMDVYVLAKAESSLVPSISFSYVLLRLIGKHDRIRTAPCASTVLHS